MNSEERQNGWKGMWPEPDVAARTGLVGMLRRQWVMIAVCAALGLVAGSLYLLVRSSGYTTAARLYVEARAPRMLADDPGVMTGSKNYLYTQAELFRSTPIVAGALKQPGVAELKELAGQEDPVARLKGMITARVGQRDDIITVAAVAARREDAVTIVNAAVEAYVAYHVSQKRSGITELLRILQQEKQRHDAELRSHLEALVRFKQENLTLTFDSDKGNVLTQSLLPLSEALAAARLETIDARADWEVQTALAKNPVLMLAWPEADAAAAVSGPRRSEQARLRAALGELQVRRALEGRRFSPDAPSVQLLDGQIGQLEQQLAESSKCFLAECQELARQRLQGAAAKERALTEALSEQLKLAQELSVKAAQYIALESELRRTERLCDILDNRIKELDVSGDTGGLNITVLERATVAVSDRPGALLSLAVAVALGLGVGVALAIHRTWMEGGLFGEEAALRTGGQELQAGSPMLSPHTNGHSGAAAAPAAPGEGRWPQAGSAPTDRRAI